MAFATHLTRRAGLPRRCRRCACGKAELRGARSAPPTPVSRLSQDTLGDFVCCPASASTKRCCLSDGAVGKLGQRHPTEESLPKGSIQATPWNGFPWGGTMLCRQWDGGRAALALSAHWLRTPGPGASLQRGTAVPVPMLPAPAQAARASLVERCAGSCLRLLYPARLICRGKEVV